MGTHPAVALDRRSTFTPSVVVVDSRALVASGIAALVEGVAGHADVFTPDELVAMDGTPDVALVGLHGADLASILEAIRYLATRRVAVIAYGRDDGPGLPRAVEAGIVGIVSEKATCSDLIEGLQRVGDGVTSLFEPGERDLLLRRARQERQSNRGSGFSELTGREREVLLHLCNGLRPADISEAEFVSVHTVRNQVQAILTKLNVHSQIEAVAVARERLDLLQGA